MARGDAFASFEPWEMPGHGREVAGGLRIVSANLTGRADLHDDERPDLGAHSAGDVYAVGRVRVEEVAALSRARDLGEACVEVPEMKP